MNHFKTASMQQRGMQPARANAVKFGDTPDTVPPVHFNQAPPPQAPVAAAPQPSAYSSSPSIGSIANSAPTNPTPGFQGGPTEIRYGSTHNAGLRLNRLA